jgi:hypothetical protein
MGSKIECINRDGWDGVLTVTVQDIVGQMYSFVDGNVALA